MNYTFVGNHPDRLARQRELRQMWLLRKPINVHGSYERLKLIQKNCKSWWHHVWTTRREAGLIE